MAADEFLDRLARAEDEMAALSRVRSVWGDSFPEDDYDAIDHLADETLPWLIRTVRRLIKTAMFLDRLDAAMTEDERAP